MQKWEYKILLNSMMATNQLSLNDIGHDGWEMVGFTTNNTSEIMYIFKRPIQETN